MWTAQPRRRLASCIALSCILLGWPLPAFALNPALDISQYAHTSWRIRDGFARGTILSIAQTPDGYLWLRTDLGMLPFDGVRPALWQPPSANRSRRTLCVIRHGDGIWVAAWGSTPVVCATGEAWGLVMMRERASQLNGTFEFDTAPGRGTTIQVVIPFR